MKKHWLPKTPWLRNEMIAAKAALSKWYRIQHAKGDPNITRDMPRDGKTRLELKDWSLYAATLGQKRGILPIDMTNWYAEVTRSTDWKDGNPVVRFYINPDDHGIAPAFYKPKGRRKALSLPISIPLQNMFWIPDPVIETTEEVMV